MSKEKPVNEVNRENMLVNDMFNVFSHQFSEVLELPDAQQYVTENRILDVVDGLRAVVRHHLGEGPYNVDTVRGLNLLHEQSLKDDVGYSLSFMPNRNEFTIQTINPSFEQTDIKGDNLYDVVMGTRKALQGGE